MNSRILASFFAAVALLGSLPAWWFLHQRSYAPELPTTGAAPEPTSSTPVLAEATAMQAAEPAESADTPETSLQENLHPQNPQPELVTAPDPGRSPLADKLNASDGDIGDDLAVLQRVLNNYLLELGSNPVGSNREITAQLSGHNPRSHTPLPRDIPAISPEGELLDRWGMPFYFHALSAREMEIRSAGPDRELYSSDDAVWSPLPVQAQPQATAETAANGI